MFRVKQLHSEKSVRDSCCHSGRQCGKAPVAKRTQQKKSPYSLNDIDLTGLNNAH